MKSLTYLNLPELLGPRFSTTLLHNRDTWKRIRNNFLVLSPLNDSAQRWSSWTKIESRSLKNYLLQTFNLNTATNMYLLNEWEGRTGKYLARGHGVRTERNEVRAPWPRAKYFPVRPDLNSVNKHFIIWALYTIPVHSEDEVWTK